MPSQCVSVFRITQINGGLNTVLQMKWSLSIKLTGCNFSFSSRPNLAILLLHRLRKSRGQESTNEEGRRRVSISKMLGELWIMPTLKIYLKFSTPTGRKKLQRHLCIGLLRLATTNEPRQCLTHFPLSYSQSFCSPFSHPCLRQQ